jgi:folate-dependent phosphoribosylglycinamide formyltransferase PurN
MIERRLILLTGHGPEHRYVANRLCLAAPIAAVVVDGRDRSPSLRRAFRGGVRPGVARLALFAFRKAVRDAEARDRALQTVLGPELTRRFVAQERVVRVDGVNSGKTVAAVAALEPDAILVFGTSIVGAEVLALARDLALNVHTGISPRYRGTDCAFWPVVNREPAWLGATVHECTAEVDGGQIYRVACAEWQPDDGIHELFARAIVAAADLYVETVLRYLADGELAGARQDLSTGREYRGYMRTLGPELSARWALRRGLLRSPLAVVERATA